MDFTSDNTYGAAPPILAAIVEANTGSLPSYGADAITTRTNAQMSAFFEQDVEVFFVTTGTAANALALAALCPPWGSVLTHQESHVMEDECGAPEFFTHGAKMIGLPGIGGKIPPHALAEALATQDGSTRRPPFKALSLAQGTEFGQIYTPAEISALTTPAKAAGLATHMDGARFSNALVALGCTPAEITWRAGIDALSFGGTKNGCLMAEAVVFFNKSLAEDFKYKRKRAGQTLSKHRLISAQFEAFLHADLWRDLAATANHRAADLARGIEQAGYRLGWPQQINEVFPILPKQVIAHLRACGLKAYEWPSLSLVPEIAPRENEGILRLLTAFATPPEAIEAFLAALKSAPPR